MGKTGRKVLKFMGVGGFLLARDMEKKEESAQRLQDEAAAAAKQQEDEILAAEAKAEEDAKEKARKLRAQQTQTILTPLGVSDSTKLGI